MSIKPVIDSEFIQDGAAAEQVDPPTSQHIQTVMQRSLSQISLASEEVWFDASEEGPDPMIDYSEQLHNSLEKYQADSPAPKKPENFLEAFAARLFSYDEALDRKLISEGIKALSPTKIDLKLSVLK